MAEPATDTTPSPAPSSGGYDFVDDLTKGMADTSKSLGDLTRSKIKTDDAITARTDARMAEDRGIAKEYFNKEAASANDLKPWNEKQEAQKYAYDPIEAFGGIGSLFGILASAFTKAPMENALNASSAAMNAVKAGKQEEYQNAFKAWKENNELVIKRGDMMHRQMQDALELFSKDSQAGEAAMRSAALKFGDQKALVMLDHGMVPELAQYYGSLGQAMIQLTKATEELTDHGVKERAVSDLVAQGWDPVTARNYAYNGYKDKGADILFRAFSEEERAKADGKPLSSEAKVSIADRVKQHLETLAGATGMQRETYEKIYAENRMKLKDDGSRVMTDADAAEDALRRATQASHPNINADQTFIGEYYAAHPNASPEEFSKAFGEFKSSQHPPPRTGAAGGPGAARVQTMEEIKADVKRDHPDWTPGQIDLDAAKRLRAANASPITGNERVKQESHIEQYNLAISDIDSVEKVLKNYGFSSGAPGYATRAMERVGNVFKSNQTDRVQMERTINQLQLEAPRLLLDSSGRPLSAEAGHINKIVAGLSMGDTVANTLRAMEELKKRFTTMRDSAAGRIGESGAKPAGTWAPPAGERVQ